MTRATTPKRSIDWQQVRTRLEASERALGAALAESPERIEAAYHQRAAQIAKGRPRREFASEGSPALVFALTQERYAVELKELAEVLPYVECTAVPGAPAEFCGVMNVRGDLRSVVDLSRLVLATAEAGSGSGFVLMLRRPGKEVGLKVDRVEGLREIRANELNPSGKGRYAKGMKAEALMLLDVDQILADVFAGEKTI
jgi:purine-binding chemotaxis protein CheW